MRASAVLLAFSCSIAVAASDEGAEYAKAGVKMLTETCKDLKDGSSAASTAQAIAATTVSTAGEVVMATGGPVGWVVGGLMCLFGGLMEPSEPSETDILKKQIADLKVTISEKLDNINRKLDYIGMSISALQHSIKQVFAETQQIERDVQRVRLDEEGGLVWLQNIPYQYMTFLNLLHAAQADPDNLDDLSQWISKYREPYEETYFRWDNIYRILVHYDWPLHGALVLQDIIVARIQFATMQSLALFMEHGRFTALGLTHARLMDDDLRAYMIIARDKKLPIQLQPETLVIKMSQCHAAKMGQKVRDQFWPEGLKSYLHRCCCDMECDQHPLIGHCPCRQSEDASFVIGPMGAMLFCHEAFQYKRMFTSSALALEASDDQGFVQKITGVEFASFASFLVTIILLVCAAVAFRKLQNRQNEHGYSRLPEEVHG
ncbi:unnamed protein product [Symbiodinium natans]|uniref:Uncharacterized protein n=1 Tax=Symbiodinium natans TaxID=878477 RepID=A0A812RJ12_9DINO|nr:unnamed protein product [Symbiodinium natans]